MVTTVATTGQRLRAWRIEHGLTMRALASQLGCSHQAVWFWEQRGQLPSVPLALAVERVTGIAVRDWVERAGT
jgi:transcriptional regulator with XRE-family HTH domain